ncbi:hypothetical protein [Rhodanobacter sp. MP1X3]|uniref:hypothetical protein n=1 Tax=Rhodanobacter sp. MP1X3 TaxID=2723086 RepID=UPI00161AC1C1|nr:hypothetical protein [Rhodanobacter sp. MP1X3]MBB6242452.1 hypothetical protein [Rhodanobacter sp. MP1X3]
MKSRYVRIAIAGLMLVLGAVSVQLLTPSTAYAQSSSTAAMTNADVVKLAKLGFGSEIIKEKINGASTVNFKLEVDDLVKLKNAGVSQDVISAMLKRADGGGASSTAAASGPANYPGSPADVTLVTKDGGNVHLRGISGTMSTTNAVVTVLMHYNYPGMAAGVRTHDTRPSFIVNSTDQPKGRIYIVSLDVDKGDQDRSLKIGNARFWGGMKNVGAPDKDNQVDYDAVSMGNGNQWKLTPTKDLKPGEYGLYSGGLFDFGVDQ